MNLKDAELQLASRRLLECGRLAQELFSDFRVRLRVEDTEGFHVSLLLDERAIVSVKGDHPAEVGDALASFLIHLTTRPIYE